MRRRYDFLSSAQHLEYDLGQGRWLFGSRGNRELTLPHAIGYRLFQGWKIVSWWASAEPAGLFYLAPLQKLSFPPTQQFLLQDLPEGCHEIMSFGGPTAHKQSSVFLRRSMSCVFSAEIKPLESLSYFSEVTFGRRWSPVWFSFLTRLALVYCFEYL